MTAAVNAMIAATKKELGIASPSKVMLEIGAQMREGLTAGFAAPAMMAPQTTNTVTNNVTVPINATLNNGMDAMAFQYMVEQAVVRALQ